MLSPLSPLRRAAIAALISTALVATTTLQAPSGQADGVPGFPGADVELEDLLAQVPGLIDALVTDRADMLRCPLLAGGTIGLPEAADEPGRKGADHGNPLRVGDRSRAPSSLPDQVIFRSTTQTFNRRYQFAVARGTIWYKSNTAVTGIHEPWAKLAVPDCFEGKVVGIGADDDEMIAIDKQRWVYGLDGALKSPEHFTWSLRWGPPLWTGPGRKLPKHTRTWAWSVVSKIEDRTWPDDAGNAHAVGDGKVSHIWLLRHRGQRLTYLDPWLASDVSYEMCGPHRGRFRSVAMSASGSTVFILGRFGDMYTRLYDFDIAGADPLFFDYSYWNQRGKADPVIQLPSPDWIHQPKIPGRITDRMSIHKRGKASVHRQLRVEGKHHGKVGYWHKDVSARRWRFTATGGKLVGQVLKNPHKDTSARRLGPSEDRRYAATTPAGHRITIPAFHPYCSPAQVKVRLKTGERFSLRLHTVDNIRQFKQPRGLSTQQRMFNGTLEVPRSVRNSTDRRIRAFVTSLGKGRFIGANLDGTRSTLAFRKQPWTLKFKSLTRKRSSR